MSALIIFFLVRPLEHDGMAEEDEKFRLFLAEHGYDVTLLGMPNETDSVESLDEKIESDDDVKLPVA